ncbi:MAG: hypothetical protein AB2768_15680, partial [Candidatus Thiodiazotropha endolucinida]
CSFENFHIHIMSAVQLKNRQRYFHETGYKKRLVSDNVQRTKTVTSPSKPSFKIQAIYCCTPAGE